MFSEVVLKISMKLLIARFPLWKESWFLKDRTSMFGYDPFAGMTLQTAADSRNSNVKIPIHAIGTFHCNGIWCYLGQLGIAACRMKVIYTTSQPFMCIGGRGSTMSHCLTISFPTLSWCETKLAIQMAKWKIFSSTKKDEALISTSWTYSVILCTSHHCSWSLSRAKFNPFLWCSWILNK